MKKLLIVFLMAILANNSFAQSNDVDYSLEGLAKAFAEYDSVASFHEGLAKVRKGDRWGYINKKGELEIPCNYIEANDFSEGLAGVTFDGYHLSFIDITGNVVLKTTYRYDIDRKGKGYFHEGLAAVWDFKEQRMGFINKQGELVIPCKYVEVRDFSEGLARVTFNYNEDKYGYIDTNGNVVIILTGYCAEQFHDGLAAVTKFEPPRSGYIDKSGRLAVPYIENFDTYDFSEGLGLVRYGYNDWYYINTQGRKVLQFANSVCPVPEEGGFHEGLTVAFVEKHNKYVYLNTSFDYVFYYFDGARSFSEGLALVKKNGKWGFIDKNGKSTFDFK